MVAARVGRLLVLSTGTVADSYWHLLQRIDARKLLGLRLKQRAYLARYGRQAWHAFEGRTTVELDEAFLALADVVAGEHVGSGGGGLEQLVQMGEDR